ncbi:MAG: metalloregulator ArsR/SmtB family transcription factor [Firmicutes bacterium]|nr:metalloregulator ArsR/SmtB family transcription factor [Bacillota bacterium]
MEEHIRLLKTLADPTRLKILKLVLAEELCVCELQSLLAISQPAVSQHLAKLKAVGLVRERKAGMWTYYRGDLARALEGLAAVMDFLRLDPSQVPEMAELAQQRSRMVRAQMCGPAGKGAEPE